MSKRKRMAHFRAEDADGREWKLTWMPETGTLIGRPLHSRTHYSLEGSGVLRALAGGTSNAKPPVDDTDQIKFQFEIPT